MRTEFVKGMQSGGPPVDGTVMMCGRVMFKKKYPVAALAACRELIRAAEGACLGLRVTLSTSRETGIGLKKGKKKRKDFIVVGF